MKTAMLLFCFVSLAVTFKITREDVLKYRAECKESSGASEDHLRDLRVGVFHDDDDTLKDYIYCFIKKHGTVNEDGGLNRANTMKMLSGSREEIEELCRKCLVAKSTPKETAYETFKCFYRNSPANRPIQE